MNLKQNLSIFFHLISSKKNRNGLYPIWVSVTLDGKRTEISTGRQIHPTHWDQSAERATALCPDQVPLKEYLDLTSSELKRHYTILLSSRPSAVAEDVKKRFLFITFTRLLFSASTIGNLIFCDSVSV
ncbi:hypothetical protein SAMN04488109_3253 [Chryseolinea serpens]|uniref:Arm DNA-binding domain-containing protein n=1 Tax=Chryseolinea serpens TaxID=947013 RepID=A0A1M5R8E1_9BACT|nr:hypothetical protein SAMN04488109_3253 [Chryseolinea serpens]